MIQPGGYTYEYTLSCVNTTPQHTMKQKHTKQNAIYSLQNYKQNATRQALRKKNMLVALNEQTRK